MKHLCISLSILTVIFLSCLLSLKVLDRTMDQALAYLDQAEDDADQGRYERAVVQIQNCIKFWEDHKGMCGTLLRHSEADDIYFTLCQLEVYARMEQEEFFGLLAETKAMMEHIKEMEKPSYYNFL